MVSGWAASTAPPLLKAEKGSTHGYDVVDHGQLNAELGTTEDFEKFADALRAKKLRHLADFVPNHVGIGSGENSWWLDVLENGPSSRYADFFDIEWEPPATAQQGKLLLPVLGKQFGEEVDGHSIGLQRIGGAFWVTYGDKRFPASPGSYIAPLEQARKALPLPPGDASIQELESIVAALRHLPPSSSGTTRRRAERDREKEVVKRRLQSLCEATPAVSKAIDDALAAISASSDLLEAFLGLQNYRLCYWRVATEEINYRRFFDINGLAAIRMEDPAVFEAAHALLLDLIEERRITGLRLDHTDGLYDPEGYFQALQGSAREALQRTGVAIDEPFYLIAEKILEADEQLPRAWAVAGTTGYDFLALVNGLWIDRAAEPALTSLHADFTGSVVDYAEVVYQSKRDVMDGSFSSEIHVLGHALKRIADHNRHARDFTLPALIRTIKEVIAAFPVYRSYVRPDGSRQKTDEAHIRAAVAQAMARNPTLERSLFDFLGDTLLLKDHGPATVAFAMRFQQLSGPLMAKGVEDTAFYRYPRLLCLNEVGADPSHFGTDPRAFHTHNTALLGQWPLSLTCTSTHDTKQSEDVRARLAVLTEIPDEWDRFVHQIDNLARGSAAKDKAQGRGGSLLSGDDVYAFYQALVGVFPFGGLSDAVAAREMSERLVAYMRKAVHEAKVHSSWTAPNQAYDDAVEQFVRGALATPEVLATVSEMVSLIGTHGASNSLAQLALRLASPGVPDLYQGAESWLFKLVDPDNRGPVDHARLAAQLQELKQRGPASPELARELIAGFADGRIKLFLTWTGLQLRRQLPDLFLEGSYQPLEASGPASEHVVAFQRRLGSQRLVCAVPRLSRKLAKGKRPWPLGEVWGDGELTLTEPGQFRSVFDGGQLSGDRLSLSKLFANFPVAWLLEGA